MSELKVMGQRMERLEEHHDRQEEHTKKLWEFVDSQKESVPVLQNIVQELAVQVNGLAAAVEITQQASSKNTGLLEGLQLAIDNYFRKQMDWGKFWSGVKDIIMKMIDSKLIVVLLFVLVASQVPGAIEGAIDLLSGAKGITKG